MNASGQHTIQPIECINLIRSRKKTGEKKRGREENLDAAVLWEGKVISMRKGKSHQVMNKVRGRWEGICVKCISHHFSFPIFLPIWEDKKSGFGRENFPLCFLSLLFNFFPQLNSEKQHFTIYFSLLILHPPCFHPNQTHPKWYRWVFDYHSYIFDYYS